MEPYKIVPNLVVEKLGPEIVVYDPATSTAHNLSQGVAIVFDACRTQQNRTDTLQALEQQLGCSSAEAEIYFEEYIAALQSKALLQENASGGMTRRTFVAAAAIPIIASVLAPLPAAAASCDICGDTVGQPPATTCGQRCSDQLGGGGTLGCADFMCARERTYNASSTNGCISDGGTGPSFNLDCRRFSGGFGIAARYAPNCNTARDQLVAFLGGNPADANGVAYYCCVCP